MKQDILKTGLILPRLILPRLILPGLVLPGLVLRGFLLKALCGFLFLLTAACGQEESGQEDGLAKFFEKDLAEKAAVADLVAHVKVTGFTLEKQSGDLWLYRIEADVLESFRGPSPQQLVFEQWIAERPDQGAIGDSVIVALHRSPTDDVYFVPEGGSAFPDDENLLKTARKVPEK
ncbi:hypothetical protein [Kiloniella laminariae]|uniref:hypothetical protein n=1 Tax=Kiloniella laminariae TaxID=454162 RepID=UPI00036EAF4A|nr:hypothetical protein [Kiloniella laminariae]